MYGFLTGPMLWLSILVFVIGLAWRVVSYIKGLDWRLERVAYGPGRDIGMKGALSSVFQWLIPFATHSWRKQPYFTVAFFFFHVGVVIAPLFLAGHMVIMNRTDWFVLGLTLFVLVAGFLARMQAPGYESWLLWHIFAAELVLILAPFTKLSHIALYFMSRGQLGMDFAIKRGGATRGPVFPW